jgi:outer membrane protein TolC
MKFIARAHVVLMLLAVAAIAAGCSAKHYRKSADKEAYKAIQQKSSGVPNMDEQFTIEQTNALSFAALPVATNAPEFLGQYAARESTARVLSLEEALDIATKQNRTYQLRKEELYLSALGLTLARYRWTPIFGAGGSAAVSGEAKRRVETIVFTTAGRTNSVVIDRVFEDRNVFAEARVDVSWLLRDVGKITAAFTTDFLRYLTGDPRTVTSSRVGATLARPLLRNAGFKAELEALTQAERDLLYDLRSFAQYRKAFSVQVASAYYAVLGHRDTVRNSHLNLLSSRKNAERTRALANEGRVTQADLGRLEQQELSAEGVWNNALRAYKQALDSFKLLHLGVPVDTNLILDDRELDALTIQHPNLNPDDAVAVALAARLDYQNARDVRDDSVRKVELAANFLKPQVDFVASGGFSSPLQRTGFPVPDPDRYNWSAGLDVDLPIDRKAERNLYREALISERRATRAAERHADEIRLEVREGWRALDQARRNYEISELGVKIAERRVEEQNLLAELGRAKAQDQVDAQNDLITSKNQRTQALVGHTIARLQFWSNMGILYIKESGRWRELKDSDVQEAQ